MKPNILSILLFIICCSPVDNNKDEIVEIPVDFKFGYGPFNPGFISMSLDKKPNNSELNFAVDSLKGIPSTWSDPIIKLLMFDPQQFAYQSYKNGHISEGYFTELKKAWKIDLENRIYSSKPLKSNSYIVVNKYKSDSVEYIIDLNNDMDFSNDPILKPPLADWTKLDSLSEFAIFAESEFLTKNGLEKKETPILVLLGKNGRLLINYPVYGHANYANNDIWVNGSFSNASFRNLVSIYSGNSIDEKQNDLVQVNEYIKIDSSYFVNLGVDIYEKVLILRKLPPNTKISSSQVGFQAPAFEAHNFLTGEEIKSADYEGKYLFIEFWGTWCGPCVKELPNLINVYENVDQEKIEFIGIAKDSPGDLEKFLENNPIPWIQVLANEKLIGSYNISSYPTSFLLDHTGQILAKNLRGENLLDTINYYVELNDF